MTTNDIDIDAIRQRLDGATEGPWVAGERNCTDEVDDWEIPIHMDGSKVALAVVQYRTDGYQFPHGDAKADADFIAHARTDIPALLDKVTELTAERDAARDHANTARREAANALRALDTANTQIATLKHELSQADMVIAGLRAEIDETDAEVPA